MRTDHAKIERFLAQHAGSATAKIGKPASPVPLAGTTVAVVRCMSTTNTNPTWDAIRRLRDELALEMHLAGMEARDRWRSLQPRIEHLENKILKASDRAEAVVEKELTAIGKALRDLRDDVKKR